MVAKISILTFFTTKRPVGCDSVLLDDVDAGVGDDVHGGAGVDMS